MSPSRLPARAAPRSPISRTRALRLLRTPLALLLASTSFASAHAATPRVHAITGARIVIEPGRTLERGTIVMRDGVIEAVGTRVSVPADARTWDASGLTVYPGLIDAFVTPETKDERRGPGGGGAPGGRAAAETPSRGAGHALDVVTPERRAIEEAPLGNAQKTSLRAAGFTLVQLAPARGVVRGQSAVVGLGDGEPNRTVVRADAAQVVSIETSGGFTDYPGSRMGAIAVIRQAFLDARWHRDAHAAYAKARGTERPERNLAWESLAKTFDGQQVLFKAPDMLGVIGVAGIAAEAGVVAQVVGNGDEYKRVKEIAKTGLPLIVPVDYPDAPDVSDPDLAIEVTTEELRHWQAAPGNAAALTKAGVRYALSATGLKKPNDFRARVADAIERGLDADAALAAVTTVPAALLGVEARTGTIAPGKIANLTIVNGDLFGKGKVREVWVDGDRYAVDEPEGLAGSWSLGSGGDAVTLTVAMAKDTTVRVIAGSDTLKGAEIELDASRLRFKIDRAGEVQRYAFVLRRGELEGTRAAETGAGGMTDVRGVRVPADPDAPESGEGAEGDPRADGAKGERAKDKTPIEAPIVMGNSEPWRMPAPAAPEAVFIRNATIWTAGPAGTLENADLLVRRGRIEAVGRGLKVPAGAVVVDATGKHVAPGIIDEHSHSAILGGVNECTNVNTAEVRIEDVINSESVEIYRQLAGGATMMHLLHGSCNAIGGQCVAIKNRWGASPAELRMANVPPTIKFALGENVKGSNSPPNTGRAARYPNSRGGVEQVYRDAFQAAVDYRAAWNEYRRGVRKIAPRKDLQLEAVLEIVEGKRQIHCHSYRQDEILMLMRVCEDFGVRVNTFTHILEGYKVADEMAKHGAAGSSFSDWWAYKYEVYDAIPYNGYLMWDRGVTVAYNSDSSELARRLNTEAAKAVKYGGVPKAEAIKFVTLNPAKTLMIDDRVGSLETGKDADFAIWSGSPLSPFSHCEQTWIEGRKYFDRSQDLEGRAALANERAALLARAKTAGGKKGKGERGGRPMFDYLAPSDLTGNDCGGEAMLGAQAEVGR